MKGSVIPGKNSTDRLIQAIEERLNARFLKMKSASPSDKPDTGKDETKNSE